MTAELNPEILEAAATWYVRLRESPDDESLHESHQTWLSAHPLHQRAWMRVQRLQHALDRAPRSVTRSTLQSARLSRRETIKALSVALMIGGGGGIAAWRYRERFGAFTTDYRTGPGGRSDITLADNTLLQLNTGTALDVNYSGAFREILLHHGEIQVSTGHDSRARPFLVRTRHGTIRALGTRFLVHCREGDTRVGVTEKAVEIRPGEMSQNVLRIHAGQQVSFNEADLGKPAALDKNANAWVRGLLIVSDWRLDHFIRELGRYRKGHLSCDDEVATMRISGAFHLKNTDIVLENLANTLPIRIRRFTRYWVKLEAV